MSDEDLDRAYKQAVIEISKMMPQLIRAMENLSRELHLMPRSLKIRP